MCDSVVCESRVECLMDEHNLYILLGLPQRQDPL